VLTVISVDCRDFISLHGVTDEVISDQANQSIQTAHIIEPAQFIPDLFLKCMSAAHILDEIYSNLSDPTNISEFESNIKYESVFRQLLVSKYSSIRSSSRTSNASASRTSSARISNTHQTSEHSSASRILKHNNRELVKVDLSLFGFKPDHVSYKTILIGNGDVTSVILSSGLKGTPTIKMIDDTRIQINIGTGINHTCLYSIGNILIPYYGDEKHATIFVAMQYLLLSDDFDAYIECGKWLDTCINSADSAKFADLIMPIDLYLGQYESKESQFKRMMSKNNKSSNIYYPHVVGNTR
jgi:hypothetical protein